VPTTLDKECTAIYDAEGLTGVNRYLHKRFPDLARRDHAAIELEDSGHWKVARYYSDREASTVPIRVVVTQFVD
jgi:hypothetical protein